MSQTMKLGILVSLTDLASGGLGKLGATVNSLGTTGAARVHALGSAISSVSGKMMMLGTQSTMVGAAITASLAPAVHAFLDMDEAITDLKATMLDANGKVGDGFDKIVKKSKEFGNTLPGSQTDYLNIGKALLQQGVSPETIDNGAFKAAANLRVALKLVGEDAATMTAKVREAFQLKDNEMPDTADLIYRAQQAGGMKPGDIMASMSYMAPTLTTLGQTGKAKLEDTLALQMIGAQNGLEGSQWGTNYSMMLGRFAKGPSMVADANKGSKGEARELMEKAHVSFDFFDAKGNLKPTQEWVKELGKLELIKQRLGAESALKVGNALFGEEGGRPAMLIAKAGVAGFERNKAAMRDRGSLDQAVEVIQGSTSNKVESLGGTLTSAMADLATPAMEWLKPKIDELNTVVGLTGQWVKENEGVVRVGGLIAGALGGGLLAVGGLGIALGTVGKVAGFAMYGLSGIMKVVGPIGSAFKFVGGYAMQLGGILRGPLATGLRFVGTAVMWLGRALLMNPIGLIVTGIALVAFLVYKNWDFLMKKWGPIWDYIKDKTNATVEWFKSLPSRMQQIGSAILDGLRQGLVNKMMAVRETLLNIGASIKSTFTGIMGIQSPSKVFMGYGGHIGEGLALGIKGNQHRAVTAANDMAYAVADAGNVVPFRRGDTGAAGGGMVINSQFSPTLHITVSGNAQDIKEQVVKALRESAHEFEQMMARTHYNQARRRLA